MSLNNDILEDIFKQCLIDPSGANNGIEKFVLSSKEALNGVIRCLRKTTEVYVYAKTMTFITLNSCCHICFESCLLKFFVTEIAKSPEFKKLSIIVEPFNAEAQKLIYQNFYHNGLTYLCTSQNIIIQLPGLIHFEYHGFLDLKALNNVKSAPISLDFYVDINEIMNHENSNNFFMSSVEYLTLRCGVEVPMVNAKFLQKIGEFLLTFPSLKIINASFGPCFGEYESFPLTPQNIWHSAITDVHAFDPKPLTQLHPKLKGKIAFYFEDNAATLDEITLPEEDAIFAVDFNILRKSVHSNIVFDFCLQFLEPEIDNMFFWAPAAKNETPESTFNEEAFENFLFFENAL